MRRFGRREWLLGSLMGEEKPDRKPFWGLQRKLFGFRAYFVR